MTTKNTILCDLDELSAIYQPGTLSLIGGRPGMGKTTIAFNIAMVSGMQTAYFIMDMKRDQLLLRYSPVDNPDWLHIDDSVSLTATDVRNKVRKLQEKYPIQLVLVDYLQLMESDSPNRMKDLAQELKTLAQETQVAVIALTQLGRGMHYRDTLLPILQDIPDWEQMKPYVDDVRLLYRDDYYHIPKKPRKHNMMHVISLSDCPNETKNVLVDMSSSAQFELLKINIKKVTDTDLLRQRLVAVEEEIIRVAKPCDGIYGWDDRVDAQVNKLLEERACILNRMFALHCTDAEIHRFEKVNDALLRMMNRFYAEHQLLRSQLDTLPLTQGFSLFAELNYCHDSVTPKLFKMDEDAFYGSRWNEMLWTVSAFSKTDAHAWHDDDKNDLDDGETWAEGPLRIPQLEHISVCYLAHALCTHLNYSIPDLLRMTTYSCERKMIDVTEVNIEKI